MRSELGFLVLAADLERNATILLADLDVPGIITGSDD
jgi:hypothetical protein